MNELVAIIQLALTTPWSTLGWMAIVLTIAMLMTSLLRWLTTHAAKIPFVGVALAAVMRGKAIPWVAAGLGAVVGLFGALAAGKSVGEVIAATLTGLLGGLAGTGLHQGVQLLSAEMRARNVVRDTFERLLVAPPSPAVSALTTSFNAAVEAGRDKPPSVRLHTLRAWAEANPIPVSS